MNSSLIDRVAHRALNPKLQIQLLETAPDGVAAPLTSYDEEQSESRLGFRIPTLLKSIYRLVGNGGFGPGYGLLGLKGGGKDDLGHDAVDLYLLNSSTDPQDPTWQWPTGLLPICHWGCAIYSCVDCLTDGSPIFVFDPNMQDESWAPCFMKTERNLESWLTAWCDGKNLWVETYGLFVVSCGI